MNRPNILWLMTDEQRTDSLGCYGSPWAHTPNLDALAARGARFTCAYTPSPVCLPARVSMLSGLLPHECGTWWNDCGGFRDVPYLTHRFEELGYATASFGKQHYCRRSMGRAQAFQHEESIVISDHVHYFHYAAGYDPAEFDAVQYRGVYPWIFGGVFPAPEEQTAEARAVDRAIQWLDGRDATEPFLLRVSLNAPHTPVAPPRDSVELIDRDAVTVGPTGAGSTVGAPRWIAGLLAYCADASVLSDDELRSMRRSYYAQVAFADKQFGRLLSWMSTRRLLDNTVIGFVSDHGTHLGDHGLVQKQTFYEASAVVPLIIATPASLSGAAGVTIGRPVETRSLLPTLLDLAGAPAPAPGTPDTAPSLARSVLTGGDPPVRPVFSELSLGSFDLRPDDHHVMLRDGPWKLCLTMAAGASAPQDLCLYNLDEDPDELTNRAADPACAPLVGRMTAAVLSELLSDA